MKERRPREAERKTAALIGLAVALIGLAALSGCSTARNQSLAMEPASIQTLQYYPYLVKGYQNSYPKRSIVVLMPTISRNFAAADNGDQTPYQGHPAIGVILNRRDQINQRLYGPNLAPLFQHALAGAAREAGMIPSIATDSLHDELQARRAVYIMAASVISLWVVKQRARGNSAGPAWLSVARVTITVTIYKPPFDVPFWQGTSEAQYNDPSMPAPGIMPADETEIYDYPGEVLSVALTRAVAGIFQHQDLYTLLTQDAASHNP